MRPLLFAAAAAMVTLGSAAMPHGIDETTVPTLNPTQMRQAFAGTAGCVVYDGEGTCESMIFVESGSGRAMHMVEVGATDIARFLAEPMAEFVRQLPMSDGYHEMFREIEIQRRRGGFRYIKTVSSYVTKFDTETSLWCAGRGAAFDRTRFYFSNSLSAHFAADEPLEPQVERQLRGFLGAVLNDPTFRTKIEPHLEVLMGLELASGIAEGCASYEGLIVKGRVEPHGMKIFVDGATISFLSNIIRPYPLDGELPLRAN